MAHAHISTAIINNISGARRAAARRAVRVLSQLAAVLKQPSVYKEAAEH